jgi:protein-L-isoaspartate(D-aspartate) O-methyltransferase
MFIPMKHLFSRVRTSKRLAPILALTALQLLLTIAGTACAADDRDSTNQKRTESDERYGRLREAMVRHQIKDRGISDTLVLTAMMAVPRHRFVPLEWRKYAYDDSPLPIGEEQTISQPYIVALMTELLTPTSNHRVLEVGTGSGYQAAVLARIVDSVFSIEIIPVLAQRAAAILDTLGYGNVVVKEGDGYRGWPEYAPFDAIIVTCAPDNIPSPLIEQLREGGTMVIPVGDSNYQELVILRKSGGTVRREAVAPVRFVPMTGEAQGKERPGEDRD